MSDVSESPKGYRFSKLVIGHAVYLYHRLPISYRDVQELLFKRDIDVSHETVRAWCLKFGPDMAAALRQRRPRQECVWHLDEMRIVMGGVVHWL
jgi:putative transposase